MSEGAAESLRANRLPQAPSQVLPGPVPEVIATPATPLSGSAIVTTGDPGSHKPLNFPSWRARQTPSLLNIARSLKSRRGSRFIKHVLSPDQVERPLDSRCPSSIRGICMGLSGMQYHSCPTPRYISLQRFI